MHARYGTWNPITRWKRTRAWKKLMAEHDGNRSQVGHIQFGIPVLYESDMKCFFEDTFQEDWAALDELLAQPWWSRTWVVQEVWCGSDKTLIQCGRTAIKWKTSQKAMDYEEAWDDMGDLMKRTKREAQWMELRRRYSLATHLSKKRLKDSKLSDLLWNTWDREVTDPRDKVFAMLGLAKTVTSEVPGSHVLTRPDYAKSMKQVYCEVVRDIIRNEGSLDILLAARGLQSGSESAILPSWVPDWRRESNEKSQRSLLIANAYLRSTSTNRWMQS